MIVYRGVLVRFFRVQNMLSRNNGREKEVRMSVRSEGQECWIF